MSIFLEVCRDFWGFLRARKKFWLGPIIFLLLAMGLLLAASSGSVLAPFIYTLF